MRSRSLLAIVLIGIGGMAAMAAVTKLAFDNDERLRDVVQFKQRVVDVFGARGVEEVLYRPSGRGGGALLRIVADPGSVLEAARLASELVDFVVESFPKSRGMLDVEFLARAAGGCATSQPYHAEQFSISKVKTTLAAKARERRVLDAVQPTFPATRLRSLGRVESRIELALEVPVEEAGRDPEKLRQIASLVNDVTRHGFAVPRNGSFLLRIQTPKGAAASSAAGSPVVLEAEYDSRGRQLRIEVLSLPKPPAGAVEDGGEVDDKAESATSTG